MVLKKVVSKWGYWPLGLGLLLVLNVIQAWLTELDPDEAYYWIYSRQLDWGYFDHPPAIAVLIRWGYSLFANELGVRLGTVLLFIASAVLLWDLVGRPRKPQEQVLLLALVLGMPILQVYGFIATPDSPLLFFTLAFFSCYRAWLEKPSWGLTLLWAIVMAGLLYSKYHGLLVIAFTVLSNVRLWKMPRFYLAGFLGALLFMPHLYWQYTHDFPSFRYHLKGRNDPYELKHTLTYLVNQVVIFSPLLFPFLVKSLLKTTTSNPLLRAMHWMTWGFWAFFLWSTSKGHVEPQWTLVAAIPLIVFAFTYGSEDPVFARRVIRMGLLTFALLLPVRILLIHNFLGIKSNFHEMAWINALKERVGDSPVLFWDSYRDPSKFAFYTGNEVNTFTDVYYRKNQFDLAAAEAKLHNRPVWLLTYIGSPCKGCSPVPCYACDTVTLGTRVKLLTRIDSLQVFNQLAIAWQNPVTSIKPGQELTMRITLSNPYPFAIDRTQGQLPLQLGVTLFQEGQTMQILRGDLQAVPEIWPAGQTLQFVYIIKMNTTLRGQFQLGLGMSWANYPPALQSKLYTLTIEE